MRIINAMTMHLDNVQVQTAGCSAIMALQSVLAMYAPDAMAEAVFEAATAHIVKMMRLHPTEKELVNMACTHSKCSPATVVLMRCCCEPAPTRL